MVASCLNKDRQAGFYIYDLVRTFKDGGGMLIGCAEELNPVIRRKGNDDIEHVQAVLDDCMNFGARCPWFASSLRAA